MEFIEILKLFLIATTLIILPCLLVVILILNRRISTLRDIDNTLEEIHQNFLRINSLVFQTEENYKKYIHRYDELLDLYGIEPPKVFKKFCERVSMLYNETLAFEEEILWEVTKNGKNINNSVQC
jgi:hypothetical protein